LVDVPQEIENHSSVNDDAKIVLRGRDGYCRIPQHFPATDEVVMTSAEFVWQLCMESDDESTGIDNFNGTKQIIPGVYSPSTAQVYEQPKKVEKESKSAEEEKRRVEDEVEHATSRYDDETETVLKEASPEFNVDDWDLDRIILYLEKCSLGKTNKSENLNSDPTGKYSSEKHSTFYISLSHILFYFILISIRVRCFLQRLFFLLFFLII